ncbi:hypothetical protein FPCIR_10330 [Fusarium pseudocircinatum]|uniref:Uncharacterized protein n=1 Tax=Fusarium pseudocircinatum TaxID=56676 RepID=A0A8H5NZD5_9HYPO|nr:hypothetical protein FPCIR_10330 [Fusarium pseudocircinatum]
MHYIDVEPSSDSNTLLAYHRFPVDVVEGDYKSDCLVHALWTACSESREAVARYWRKHPYDILSLPPARLRMRENGEVWDAPNIYLNRIAFEFDPTWNMDLPGNYDDLASEKSARGCFSRFFYAAFFKYTAEPHVYLIEKSGQWTCYLPNGHFSQSAFCKDYDTGYALVQPFYKCFRCQDWHESDGAFANVRSFISKLEELCEAYEPDRPNTKHDHYVDLNWIKRDYLRTDCIQYIARLDKKIEDCVGLQVNTSFPLLRPTWDEIWDLGFM